MRNTCTAALALAAATAIGAAHAAGGDLPLRGFADVGWAQRSAGGSGSGGSGFHTGNVDLYFAPALGERIRILVELVFETTREGGLATDLERAQMGYLFGDALTLWIGRFHLPIGYWNTAYHHGAQIQTSITRPYFLNFEDQGGILPVHAVGLWGAGQFSITWGKLAYDLTLSNGNRINEGVLDFNAAGDDNRNAALSARLGFTPRGVPGLTLGVHGLQQVVAGGNADRTQQGRARVQALGAWFHYDQEPWELLGEYYRFRNRDLGAQPSPTLASDAAYVQAAYSVSERWTGFVRWERTRLDLADPYFALQDNGRSYRSGVAGVSFELDPRAALKLQWDRRRENGAPAQSWLRVQYAVRF